MALYNFHPVLGLQEILPKPPANPNGWQCNLATGEPNAPTA